jgi:hypothetical protein
MSVTTSAVDPRSGSIANKLTGLFTALFGQRIASARPATPGPACGNPHFTPISTALFGHLITWRSPSESDPADKPSR